MRRIHEPSVRDRVLYQAIYKALYQTFDKSFIYDVFSSRNFRGTHAGVKRFTIFSRKVSSNFTRSVFVLKCDIRKFFDSIDHSILFGLISKKISDEKLLNLIRQIIDSFHHTSGKGLPLGNVTSQLFANIHMNEFDQFVKHALKAKYYIRYCDDFVILHQSKKHLLFLISKVQSFLKETLLLELHPNKVSVRKIHSGIDFLGYVSLPHYKVLRTKTKNRILKKIARLKCFYEKELITRECFEQSIQSYLGVLAHCKSEKIRDQIGRIFLD